MPAVPIRARVHSAAHDRYAAVMAWPHLRSILAYGLLAAVVLACLHLVSLAPMALGVGRELAGAAIAVVAMAVGLILARGQRPRPAASPAANPDRPAPPAPAPVPASAQAGSATEPVLTQREQQVLRLLCAGHSNKAMARALHLSENTVKTHVASVFAKLGVNRRAQVQEVAARLGLLESASADP